MYLKFFLTIAYCMVFSMGSISAQTEYSADVQLYTSQEGLPNNHVYQCFQDHRGLLWLLTGGGLCRFDGQQFKLILAKGFHTDFSKNKILFEEANGDLWISTNVANDSIHYIILNTITGQFSTPQQKFGKALPAHLVDVVYAGNQTFWVSTTSGELLQIKQGKLMLRIDSKLGFAPKVYAADGVRQTVLVGIANREETRDQVCRLFSDQGKIIGTYTIPYLQGIQLDSKNNYRFYSLSQVGVISSAGIFSQEPIVRHLPNYIEKDAFDNAWPLVFDSKSQRYWMLHDHQLDVFQPQKGQIHLSNSSAQFFPHGAYSIFIDKQSTAWVCTIEGLYQIKINQERFQRLLWSDPSKNENRLLMSCRGIVKDESNKVLYASAGNCLWAIRQGQAPQKLFCREIAIYALSMTGDKSAVLAGCEGLYSHNVQQNTTRKLLQIPRYFTIAWSFLTQGKLSWIGLNNGLAYWNSETADIVFVDSLKSHPALSNAIIHNIIPKDEQQLWLLTEKGLFLFDTKRGIMARYWTGGKGKFKLPVEDLRNIYSEKKDLWWLATAEGLLRWNPESGQSRLFTTADGLPNNNIYAVYPDAHGFLWMSSDKGIIQFQKSTSKTRVFLPIDGITHLEFNRISHYQDQDGRIYFGSLNGITTFHPDDFYQDFTQAPNIPLVLTSANLFSQKSNLLEDAEQQYVKTKKIIFTPDDLYLTLRFALLDYANLGSNKYEYRIEGLGSQWASCLGGFLQLAGLPYGHFQLRIRAKTANGLYSSNELLIPIQVLRPFYLQWWFLLLLLSGISAGIIAYFRYRSQLLKQRKVELEKEVAIQTEKIREDKAIIEAQAQQLIQLDKAKNRFFANVTHELRTPLTLIQGPISTHLAQHGLSKEEAPLLYLAQQNSIDLLSMVNDLLDLGKLEAGKLPIHEQPMQLLQKIKLLIDSFEANAWKHGIALYLDYQADPQLKVRLDLRLLTIILNNLLSNALKFTEKGGKIILRVIEVETNIQIEVEDTGRGIHPNDLPYVFDRYFQTQHVETAYEGGTGIGLALAKEASKAIDGTLEARSKWGQGSTFILRFPKQETTEELVTATLWPEEFMDEPLEDLEMLAMENAQTPSEGRLLLVEDNADLRFYLAQVLGLHYQVDAVANGQEAQVYLAEFTPDLIITDIMMPQVDGFQLLKWLKSGPLSSIPVIMLTARADSVDRVRALRKGVDDYLVKPFVESELLARIHNLIQRQNLRISYAEEQEEGQDEEQIGLAQTSRIKIPAALTEDEKQWLDQLEQILIANLGNVDYTVNDLAKGVLMSRSIFYSQLKRLLGLTPNEYINEIRLLKAMELFKSNPGVYSVKEMSGLVGFQDERYFSRQFKQRFGILPSQV